jgi:hypothetical protein
MSSGELGVQYHPCCENAGNAGNAVFAKLLGNLLGAFSANFSVLLPIHEFCLAESVL